MHLGSIARRTMAHKIISIQCTDQGHLGWPRMRAALGTAGDVQRRVLWNVWRERRRECASFDARLGTGRRAGAGNDPQQRIVGTGDEAIMCGHFAQTFEEDHAPWRHPQAGREGRKMRQCRAFQLAECQSDQRATFVNSGLACGGG